MTPWPEPIPHANTARAPDHWVALGVQQHVLQRVLASVCHDLAGHFSVMRMIGMMLGAQLKKEPLSRPALQEPAEALTQEVAAASASLQFTRSFAEPDKPIFTADECLGRVATLMKTPARIAGHQLMVLPAEGEHAASPTLTASVLLALAGLVCRAIDRAEGPQEIRLQRVGDTFEVTQQPNETPAPILAASQATALLDDPGAFRLFLAHLGYWLSDSPTRQSIAPIQPTLPSLT